MSSPVFKVMIIEDNHYQSRYLEIVLQEMGNYESCVHTSADQAVEHIMAYLPDLVILDLQLPENGKMDVKAGYKILKELRSTQGKLGKSIAIIIYSAVSTLEDKLRSILAGECDDFLVKTTDKETLKKRIKEYCWIGHINKEYTRLDREYKEALLSPIKKIFKKEKKRYG